MNRRDLNRLAQAATSAPDIAVDLGTVTMHELQRIVEALSGQARVYHGHPRADFTVALARKLIDRGIAAEIAHNAAGDEDAVA